MSSATFDRHIYIKKFIAKGMSEELAEDVTDAIRVSKDADFAHLATKADLRELELRIDNKIGEVKTAIAETKSEMKGWLLTGVLGIISLLVTILFKLH
jgi:hypothetical protein